MAEPGRGGKIYTDKVINLQRIEKSDNPEPIPYYFQDGIRRIYCIIVLSTEAFKDAEAQTPISSYLEFMQLQGLELEYELGHKDSSLLYVKIHAPASVIKHLANLYDVDINNPGHNYIPDTNCRWGFRQTKLTDADNDVFKRTGAATSCEVIYLIFRVLYNPVYLGEDEVYGLDKMIKLGFFKDAYPLHDGPYDGGSKNEDLHDRQLLSRYWANWGMFYKEQPINLIEKYYGSDIAFFFAWCEFYLFMLLLLTLAGVASLAINLMAFNISNPKYIQQICNSTFIMCPLCETEGCHFGPIIQYCRTSKYEYILGTTIQYAVIIAIWVSVFLEFWRRRENTLSVRWNVFNSKVEYNIRNSYQEHCTFLTKSRLTGQEELRIPVGKRVSQYSVTVAVLIVLILICTSFALLLSLTKGFIAASMRRVHEPKKTLSICFFYGLLQAVFVKICSLFYVRLCFWVTDQQVPKTEKSYDMSVVYTIYLFGFLNNYFPIMYTALFRDNILVLPGLSLLGNLDNNNCLPTGCILTIAIQLVAVTFLKYFGDFLILLIQFSASAFDPNKKHPTWEREYYLDKHVSQFMFYEFSEMMVQFGYVSFLMAMCPFIGPIAFISNILRIKLDAIRLNRQMRRPIPKRNKGIGPWNDILKFASYFSVVCNAFIVGFNTRFITFAVHGMYGDVKRTYFDFLFSKFAVEDIPIGVQRLSDAYSECLYTGQKNPPISKFSFKKSDDYYAILTWQFIFIIAFENIILLVIVAIHYFIDDIPKDVREQLRREKQVITDKKLAILQDRIQSRVPKTKVR